MFKNNKPGVIYSLEYIMSLTRQTFSIDWKTVHFKKFVETW